MPITACPFFFPTDTQGFSINDKGYVYNQNQLAEYDPQLDAWSLKTNAPVNFTNWSCCFAIEGSGFIKQGALLYEFKPLENSWIQRANFPGVCTGGSSGFAINQKGFVTCGYVGGLAVLTKQAWYFSPGTNTWTAAEDFSRNK
jgi:N-acetylneuraminic acid mutarotase